MKLLNLIVFGIFFCGAVHLIVVLKRKITFPNFYLKNRNLFVVVLLLVTPNVITLFLQLLTSRSARELNVYCTISPIFLSILLLESVTAAKKKNYHLTLRRLN